MGTSLYPVRRRLRVRHRRPRIATRKPAPAFRSYPKRSAHKIPAHRNTPQPAPPHRQPPPPGPTHRSVRVRARGGRYSGDLGECGCADARVCGCGGQYSDKEGQRAGECHGWEVHVFCPRELLYSALSVRLFELRVRRLMLTVWIHM